MTPDEEYAYLWDTINSLGNFFAWDVHPNKVRATEMHREKLRNKLQKLVDSPEFKDYNPHW